MTDSKETAIKLHDLKKASSEEVARYYLSSEIHNVVTGNDAKLRNDLSTKELWRLMEALSYTYRANYLFHVLSDQGLDWFKTTVNVDDITLTGMNPDIDKITYSADIQSNPIKFRDYLLAYFSKHKDDDPERLSELRPRPIKPGFERIIIHQRHNKLKMLDGTHRFVAQLLSGKTKIDVYCGIPNGKPKGKMRGDTIFLSMRDLFEQTESPDIKEAILTTTKQLAIQTIDAKKAIKRYWVDHSRVEATKKTGEELLGRL